MSNLSDQKLITIVPSSISGDKTIRNISAAADPELRKISSDTLLLLLLPRLDELPERIIDALAWQYHVDFYDDAATLEKKRSLVKQSIKWHRRKGTPSVVEEVCTAVFKSAKVEENWEYSGKPYHFKVMMITEAVPDISVINSMYRAIEHTKNVRSWLDEVSFHRDLSKTIYYALPVASAKVVSIYPAAFRMSDISGTVQYAMGNRIQRRVEIR